MLPGSLPIILAMLVAIYALKVAINALRIVLTKRPVCAVVVADSYGEARSLAARRAHPFDWLYKVTAGNAKPAVGNDLTVRYVVDDTSYQTIIHIAHLRGDRPDPSVTLWYDPAEPASAENLVPGRDAFMAMMLLGAAASIAGWIP